MTYRNRLICALLAISVLALTVCPVPVGQGPFSAAYGPATKFQALLVVLLLMSLLAAASATRSASVPAAPIVRRGSNLSELAISCVSDPPSVNFSLRC
jgi:hypothetical protein